MSSQDPGQSKPLIRIEAPPINLISIAITPDSVEEYHGICIRFAWLQAPLAEEIVQQLQAQVQQEFQIAFDRRMKREREIQQNKNLLWVPQPVLGEELEQGLLGRLQRSNWGSRRWSAYPEDGVVRQIVQVIRHSQEWKAFYTDPDRHITSGWLDGAGECWGKIKIPEFRTDEDLEEVTLTAEEGTVIFRFRA